MSGKLFKLRGGEPLIKKIRWKMFDKGVEHLDQRKVLTRPRVDRSEPCMSGKLFKLRGGEPLIKKIMWKMFEKGSNI